MDSSENNNTNEMETNNQELLKEEENKTIEENKTTEENKKGGGNKKGKRNIIIIIIAILLIIIGLLCLILFKDDKKELPKKVETQDEIKYSEYRMSGNSLEKFDLYFLKLENSKENKVYSPLSIKYALRMLEEGAKGESKKQISDVLGNYSSNKYTNSKNMSLANALFVRDSYKDYVNKTYVDKLSSKYNAEVIYDSFETPKALNSWASEKTFKLINNMVDDISEQDFILVNALAIDMEWVKKIQSEHEGYYVHYDHENFSTAVPSLDTMDYHLLDFKGVDYKVKSAEITAVANKYDIVNTVGEDKIREIVGKEYEKWLAEGACGNPEGEPDTNTYLDKYIKEINTGYKQISTSTDFEFYDDENVKVFAKDLKEYDGTTLQYMGIMPKNGTLEDYINNIKPGELNDLISNLKSIDLGNFKEGVITEVSGYIPMFKFEYQLDLIADLKKMGIVDVFDSDKANLSNLTSNKAFINQASHKTQIEFSNEGIKAAAVTSVGGAGNASCEFDYLYEVPVERIDLTFDSPYLFLVRDKDSGEVWFAGTVYEPVSYRGYYEENFNR